MGRLLLLACLLGGCAQGREAITRSRAKIAAWKKILSTIDSPSMTKEVSSDVVYLDSKRVIVFESFDSPNGFGVPIRVNMCVCLSFDNGVRGQFEASEWAVRKCNGPPSDFDLAWALKSGFGN